jgi:hypothetical protein
MAFHLSGNLTHRSIELESMMTLATGINSGP